MYVNNVNTNYICPLITNGECRFKDLIVTESTPQPYVFYAFDWGKSASKEDKITIRAIKSELEIIISENGFDFISCNQDSSNASIDWFCQNVCSLTSFYLMCKFMTHARSTSSM